MESSGELQQRDSVLEAAEWTVAGSAAAAQSHTEEAA